MRPGKRVRWKYFLMYLLSKFSPGTTTDYWSKKAAVIVLG
jgi:hypothetical protein